MPKGYIIAHIDVHDPDEFQRFREKSAPVVKEYGGKVLVGHPAPEQREGASRPTTIVVEFDDIETARKFYESQGYSEARAIREACAETDLMIVEGFS